NTITWMFVVRMAAAGTNNQWLVNYHFEGGDFPYGDLNSLIPSTARRLSANMRDDANKTQAADPAFVIRNDEWYVVSVVWDGVNGTLAQYVDGTRTGYKATGATRTLPQDWVYLGIGNRYQGTRSFEGDIAEFVLYNTALSDSDRWANERELALKYGLGPTSS